MADASKLKSLRRSGLGTPPPPEEARTDLAPKSPVVSPSLGELAPALAVSGGRSPPQIEAASHPVSRMDGRTMRRSGRTVQFATRVSPEFDERIRQIAMRDGLLLVEVLERALDAYETSCKKAAI